MLKLSTATPGQIATKLFLHPLDPNMAATFDGRIWTRYVAYKRGGVIGEWRELTKYTSDRMRKESNRPKTSNRTKTKIAVPTWFAAEFYPNGKRGYGTIIAGRFTLECYLGRRLESY